jgi:hypothetical protein
LLGAEARHLTTATTRASEAEDERQLTTDPTRASEAEEERHLATSVVVSAQPATHGLKKRRLEELGSTRATVPTQSSSDVISTCMMSAEDKAMCTRIKRCH